MDKLVKRWIDNYIEDNELDKKKFNYKKLENINSQDIIDYLELNYGTVDIAQIQLNNNGMVRYKDGAIYLEKDLDYKLEQGKYIKEKENKEFVDPSFVTKEFLRKINI